MARTPPTHISTVKTASMFATTTPRSTASVSWLAGDKIIVIGGVGDEASNLSVPTATGLTFTQKAFTNNPSGNFADVWVWEATAGSNGSSTINGTRTSGGSGWFLVGMVFRGSDGVGATAVNTSTTKTLSLTRGQAESAAVYVGLDYSAPSIAATFTPTVDTSVHNAKEGTSYGVHIGLWTDEDAAGSTTYGVTSTSTGNFAKAAFEVLGKETGGAVMPDVIISGAKKTVVNNSVIVSGAKKTVVGMSVIQGGVKKTVV